MPLPGDIVAAQIQAIFNDYDVKAVKIGQIPNLDVANAIVNTLQDYYIKHSLPIM